MKKYILFVVSCFMLFMGCVKGEVYSGEFYAGDKIQDVYIVKIDSSGNVTYKQGNFIIDSLTGEYVYCLEPFVMVDNTYEYNIVTSDFATTLGISEDTWEYINLIAYYGYGYGNHTDSYWYYVTQVMIWRVMEPDAEIYFTAGLKGEISIDAYCDQIQEIQNLVAAHYVTPSFSLSDMYINDTYYLNDLNGVLANFTVSSDNAYIDGNTLVVTPSEEELKITISKNLEGSSKVFVSSESQNVLSGANPVDVATELVIKASPKTGSITIVKYGEVYQDFNYTYEYMEGACFTLYDDGLNLVLTKCSDVSGVVEFSNLALGTYYIEEISTLEGYELDSTRYEVILSTDSNNAVVNQTLEVYNDLYKGGISILKTGEDCYDVLEGVVFGLYDENMNLLTTASTSESGTIHFSNLALATYYLKEISTIDGYILSDEVIEVSLSIDKMFIILNLVNEEYKGSITLTKYGENNIFLEGVTYSLYDEDMNLLNTLDTNELGKIVFSDLPLGTYYLQEISTLSEYRLNDELIEVFITEDNLDINIDAYNELKTASIVIVKIDSDTLEYLSNATFNLYDSEYNLIYEGTTDNDGTITIDDIKLGTYILEEVSAPDGYELIDYSYEFSLDTDNSKITITVKNDKEIIIDIPDTFSDCIYNIILFYKKKYNFI